MPSITVSFNERNFRVQLQSMLKMQGSMNSMVFPDWRVRGLAWHRAIYIEAGEYLEHMGTWKWWKKGTPDFPQANMELVDIWHFALSWYIERYGESENDPSVLETIVTLVSSAVYRINSTPVAGVTDEMRHAEVDRLVAAAGARMFDTHAFVTLLAYSGMDFDQLALRYTGKNMLNRLRQDNGYKAGTYLKVWGDVEDNVHLDGILEDMADAASPTLAAEVYAQLSARYQSFACKCG